MRKHIPFPYRAFGLLVLLGLGLFSSAQAQSQTTYRGDIAVHLKDGTVEYTDRINLGQHHVRLGKWRDQYKIDADWVEYVDVITNLGRELHLVQAEIETRMWGMFPVVNKAWLKRYWASDRIELFRLEEVRWDNPTYTGYGNWVGGGTSQTVKYFYRKDYGQVKEIRPEFVLQDVQDHPEAFALAERAQKTRRVGQILSGVGIAGVVGGLYAYPELAEQNTQVQLGMSLTGLGILTAGAIMSMPTRAKLLKALRTYE
ncbi:MAG: hypothetical protein AAFQ98_10970 [Bacteroidota bacterium]